MTAIQMMMMMMIMMTDDRESYGDNDNADIAQHIS